MTTTIQKKVNVISIIIGICCFVPMSVGIIPFLGWLQWLVVGGSVLGVIFGALSREKSGLYINLVVLAVAIVRLLMGGGII
jgi:hypothetical protein